MIIFFYPKLYKNNTIKEKFSVIWLIICDIKDENH